MSDEVLLDVQGLRCTIPTPRGDVRVLSGVDAVLHRGQTLGLVGESGSGKSMFVRSLMGITPAGAELQGRALFDGRDLLSMPRAQAREIWGRRIGMVFQDPMTSLNPVVRIGRQIGEAAEKHLGLSRHQARKRAIELLELVGIPEASRRHRSYPHEFSGGMRQRVTIAMALACEPDLLIADEATTALDVTVQRQILDLLQEIQAERHMAMILVSHDLGLVSGRCDEVAVMYAGRIVEKAATKRLFDNYQHRYTEALLQAIPRLDGPKHTTLATIEGTPPNLLSLPTGCAFAARCDFATEACTARVPDMRTVPGSEHSFACVHPAGGPRGADGQPIDAAVVDEPAEDDDEVLLRVDDLVCEFKTSAGTVQAVSGVSFDVRRGEVLALVGESGCGKSTTGKAIIQLPGPTSGDVVYGGDRLGTMPAEQFRQLRRKLQIIFQDPISALNPRRKVRDIIGEGLDIAGVPRAERDRRVEEVMRQVGLDPSAGDRRPREFSGGQCQRIAIARAIVMNPDLLICDEPVASLDVSIQAQILNILQETKRAYDLSLVFISHDLAVVHSISDRIAVMYLGKIVEIGDAKTIVERPAHPYTNILLDSAPAIEGTGRPSSGLELQGEVPSPLNPPSGCRFRTRCPLATERCATETPELTAIDADRQVACHYPLERANLPNEVLV